MVIDRAWRVEQECQNKLVYIILRLCNKALIMQQRKCLWNPSESPVLLVHQQSERKYETCIVYIPNVVVTQSDNKGTVIYVVT